LRVTDFELPPLADRSLLRISQLAVNCLCGHTC
jgi:hypothetical protein